MGKSPYIYTESESEDTSISSSENKKKKRFSLLKYTKCSGKKQKCKIQSKSEPEESDYHSKTRSRKVRYKLPGILKHPHVEMERETSEDDDSEPVKPKSHDKYLVGRVPRPAGTNPGRGGGVAILVKKHVNNIPAPQSSTTSPKRKKASTLRRLSKKRSY
ncbi:hypothetical protein HW555_003288 [Spodoptera exigua]|uniref:Uncharacterized protein n=1 Tax=Spodoptera exigua TaxID=7107 RepID=A0A835L8N0_SPOEX|nr:hypothetical protein HW555_003288 [Spodoptera exigua]